MRLEGIHHVTAITGDAPANVDFYGRVLGCRDGGRVDDGGPTATAEQRRGERGKERQGARQHEEGGAAEDDGEEHHLEPLAEASPTLFASVGDLVPAERGGVCIC